jgi:hypothetical protein
LIAGNKSTTIYLPSFNNIKINKGIMRNFIRTYLDQNPLSINAKYVHNAKITITLKLLENGNVVVGYQDKRMPTTDDNNLIMVYCYLVYVKKPKPFNNDRIDSFIDKLLPSGKQETGVAKTSTGVTIKAKAGYIVDKGESFSEMLQVMTEVLQQAETMYWINSGLKQAEEFKRLG